MKDEGKGFGLPKCTVRSRERRRAQGASPKDKGKGFILPR